MDRLYKKLKKIQWLLCNLIPIKKLYQKYLLKYLQWNDKMKLKIVIYSFVLLLSMILLNNCTASMLGVPDTFKGYYQSVNTVLDDKTYLFFRVSAGGLTIYLGDDGTTNIKRTEYTSISP